MPGIQPLDPGVDALIEGAAKQYDVDPDLMRAVTWQESHGNPFTSDSTAGAKGISQFLPRTMAEVMGPDANPYDVPTAIAAQAKYLAQGIATGEKLGVADPAVYAARYYNGGPRGPDNPATLSYASDVAGNYQRLASARANRAPAAPIGAPPAGPGPISAPSGTGAAGTSTMPIPPMPELYAAGTAGAIANQHFGRGPRSSAAPSPGGNVPDTTDLPSDLDALRASGSPPTFLIPGTDQPAVPPPERPLITARGPFQFPPDIDALATSGGSSGAAVKPPASGAGTSAASADLPDINKMSDVDFVTGVASGKIPWPPPGGAAPTPPPPAAGPSGAAPSQAAPPSATVPGTPTPPEGAVPLDSIAGRQARIQHFQAHDLPDLAAQEQRALDLMQTTGQVPYRMPDGSTQMFPIPGGRVDPAQIARTEGASAAGRATVSATQEMVPAWVRMPDGSVVQQQTRKSDYVAGGPAPGGGTFTGEPYFTPAQQSDQKAASDEFAGLRQTYANNQSAALNLQNFLDAAQKTGTGPGTKFSGDVANWLKSIGVADPTKIGLADPGAVAVMNKAAQRLVFNTIGDVTKRPAYLEFKMSEGANPNADMDPAAVRELAGALQAKMNWENAKFEAWNADARQPGHSSYNFDPVGWSKANPMPQYMGNAMSQIPTIPESGALGTRGAATVAPPGGPAPPIATPQAGPRRSRFVPGTGIVPQ